MKRWIGILLLLSLFGCSAKTDEGMITADDAQKKIENGAVLIDVREPDEYTTSHINRSINLPLSDIEQLIIAEVPDKDTEIIVYCRSGSRSKQAQNRLKELGYTKVFDLGGINNWPYEVVK